jgi:hypothetical protein
MNTSKSTKMQHRFIDAHGFSTGPWGQSRGQGFHLDRASMLRFIGVPYSWPYPMSKSESSVRGSDLISEQISELT